MNTMDLKTRAEQWRYYHRTGPTSASHDVMLFLDRMEQLREELAEANARRGDLRTALEWANEERDRLREQLAAKHSECPDCADYAARSARFAEQADQLMRERDEARASVADAYRRGAEAMREACIWTACAFVMSYSNYCDELYRDQLEAELLALPIPEDK